MTESDGSAGMERRHFSRRAFAFLLDAILATLIITLLFGAIRAVTGTDLGTPSLASFTQSNCDSAPIDHPQVIRVEKMWPLAAGQTRQHVLCRISVNGTEQPLMFISRVISRDGAATYTSEARYPVDDIGQPLAVDYPMDWSPVAYIVIFAAFTAKGRRTPGKASMALRVTTDAGSNLSWPTAFKREALKFLPFVVYFVAAIWFALFPPAMLSDSEAIIIAMRDGGVFTSAYAILFMAFGIGMIVWWVGPFLVWRGRTWYDAVAGTKLIRTDRDRPTARPRG